jgi:acetyl esterase/lipase
MQAVLDELDALKGKPIETLDANEARKQPTPADAVKKLMKARDLKPEEVGHVDNRSIPSPAGKLKVRVYTPKGVGPFPLIVYFHGGGFVIADLDTYDATPRSLCRAVDAVVVSVQCRKGPEHRFPAAHDDAFSAYEWVANHAADLKGDANRIALAGESAGGNLAISVAMAVRDGDLPAPRYLALVYPVVDNDMTTPSYQNNANAKPLNKAMMKWFFEHETMPANHDDSRLVPLRSDLGNLPATTLVTAEIDPLHSEGEAFARRLQDYGVTVNYLHYPGVTHEFFGMGAVVPTAREAMAAVAGDLRAALATR